MTYTPNKSTISSSCCISDRPGNNGLCPNSSPRIHPAAHMSTLVV